jgi:hypothetical protein
MHGDTVQERSERMSARPAVAAQGRNMHRSAEFPVPGRNLPQNSVILPTVCRAPRQKAQSIANATVLQGKTLLCGWPHVPDREHSAVESEGTVRLARQSLKIGVILRVTHFR